MTEAKEGLNPCPFCDSKAFAHQFKDENYAIICESCLSSSASYKNLKATIKAWNRRTPRQLSREEMKLVLVNVLKVGKVTQEEAEEVAEIIIDAIFKAQQTKEREK